eukprot:173080-Chlamydomonas_euryale.AAC.5
MQQAPTPHAIPHTFACSRHQPHIPLAHNAHAGCRRDAPAASRPPAVTARASAKAARAKAAAAAAARV